MISHPSSPTASCAMLHRGETAWYLMPSIKNNCQVPFENGYYVYSLTVFSKTYLHLFIYLKDNIETILKKGISRITFVITCVAIYVL